MAAQFNMEGLLGLLQSPQMQGIAQGLLSVAGPSNQPRSIGDGLLMGQQIGQNNMMNAARLKQAETQQKLADMQLGQAQTRQKAIENFAGNLNQMAQPPGVQYASAGGMSDAAGAPGVANGMPGMTPQLAAVLRGLPAEEAFDLWKQVSLQSFKPRDPVKLGEGETLVDPVTYRQVASGGEKPPAQGMVKDANGNWKFLPGYIAGKKEIASAGAARNTVSLPPNELAYDREMGESLAKKFTELQNNDLKASGAIANMKRLGSMLDQVNTGKFTGTTTELKAAAKGLGIDLSAMGIKDDVSPAEAARALANELTLQMRDPSTGAGMPGALSNQELQFLGQMVPGLEMSPAGRKMLLDWRVKLAERSRDVARLARDHTKKNGGRLTQNFYSEVADWAEQNPLFKESDFAAAQKLVGGQPQQQQGGAARMRFDAMGNQL